MFLIDEVLIKVLQEYKEQLRNKETIFYLSE